MKLKKFLVSFLACLFLVGLGFADRDSSGNRVVLEGLSGVSYNDVWAEERAREKEEKKKKIIKYTTIAAIAAAYAGLKVKKS
jgi:hypothetical protein